MRYLDAFEGKYGIVLQPDYYAVAVFVIAPKIEFLRDIGTVCFFYADRPALIEDYVTHIRGEIRIHRPQTVREPVPAVVYIIPCRAVYPRLFAAAVSAVVYSVRCCYAAPENISSAEKNGSTRLKLPTVSFKRFKLAIDEYEKWVVAYTKECRIPMLCYTAAINAVFAFLIAGGLLFTGSGVTNEFLLNLLFYIIITPIISVTLTKIMYMSENNMIVEDAMQRIDSLLNMEPMPEAPAPKHPKDASVTLEDVHFSYDGKTEVIGGVSLHIKPGRTVAFVGPSGGGKSTLASLLSRFFDVQGGSIRIGGADIRDIPKEELMDTVSFVFQNSKLIKGSILDNVKMGRPEATREEVMAALKAAQCMDIIEKFPKGVDTILGTKGIYLSGGEQQRIAIARAVLKNAPVIILDEATAFADPDNEVKVQAAFAELARGKTVIMIAHRLSTVSGADCIYVIEDGRIVESGSRAELNEKDGLFARMWKNYQLSVRWKVAKEG